MKSLEEREQRGRERREIIVRAVQAADRIIMNGSDGSVEETNYLTSEVAKSFVEKVNIGISGGIFRKDMSD